MTVQEQIAQLPRNEKVKLMESLWSDLSQPEANYTSPVWHDTELKATAQRVAEGKEDVLDWDEAKKRLKNG